MEDFKGQPDSDQYADDIESRIKKKLDIDSLLKDDRNLEYVAEQLLEGTFSEYDMFKRDTLDKFLDFVIVRVKTGLPYILNMAYPSKRMSDKNFENKIIILLNTHLYPEIVYRILKYFARNVTNADVNLYLAYLITSDAIIQAVYDTFIMFRKDIFEPDKKKRKLNVKRLQQFPSSTAEVYSSPLDAAARFKYILEYIALKQNVEHIYTRSNIFLSGGESKSAFPDQGP